MYNRLLACNEMIFTFVVFFLSLSLSLGKSLFSCKFHMLHASRGYGKGFSEQANRLTYSIFGCLVLHRVKVRERGKEKERDEKHA